MHPHLLRTDEIDDNLYPALVQVFSIILIGYAAGSYHLISKEQAYGLNKFVSTFALPALLFKSLIVLDFSSVNWYFLLSIFVSKSLVFFAALFLTLLIVRPLNLGLAAALAIFVSQSNDFALGYPIVDAVFSRSHPEYLRYIYLIAPISLCILNPIAFFLLEMNQKLQLLNAKSPQQQQLNRRRLKLKGGRGVDGDNASNARSSNYRIVYEESSESEERRSLNESASLFANKNETGSATCSTGATATGSIDRPEHGDLNRITRLEQQERQLHSQQTAVEAEKTRSNLNSATNESSNLLTTQMLIKSTFIATISNPIVFMTIVGIVANFVFRQQIPALLEPMFSTLAGSFSALALFYLGYTMFGKIRNLRFSSVILITVLIFTKSVVFPLITREAVLHISGLRRTANSTETNSLSAFGFLYGTFPTAPSLFFFISPYGASVDQDLISTALVFGTLASAPLMMVSGKMIALEYNSTIAVNYEDIKCKTAYGFSMLTWFGCIWTLYVLLASGRLLKKPFLFTFYLLLAQMCNSLVHIVWSTFTGDIGNGNSNELPTGGDTFAVYAHFILALLAAFATRCWLLNIVLGLISSSSHMLKSSMLKSNKFIYKLANTRPVYYFLGLIAPFACTLCCLVVGGPAPLKPKNPMLIELDKAQLIIASSLLLFIIVSVFYSLAVFVRCKYERLSLISLMSSNEDASVGQSINASMRRSCTDRLSYDNKRLQETKDRDLRSDFDALDESKPLAEIEEPIEFHMSEDIDQEEEIRVKEGLFNKCQLMLTISLLFYLCVNFSV
jgi:predicted permease